MNADLDTESIVMTDSIFHLDSDGSLVEMRGEPYESEDLLQTLLERHPALLAGSQISPDEPRRWLLVRREARVPDDEGGADRWSVDHLFLDQDGVPTLIEVKRSSDTRIRREVVGQMLDYASNFSAYWSADRVRAEFDAHCENQGVVPSNALVQAFGGGDEEEYWESVKTNLQANRLRLLFVADELPRELRRIIEFLNAVTDPLEVLGVEVRHYVGEDRRTIVPRVVGQSETAQARKGARGPRTKWDEERFFESLGTRHGEGAVHTCRRLLDWAKERDLRIWWGEGQISGSFIVLRDGADGTVYYLFTAWTYARICIEFLYIGRAELFATEDARIELLDAFNGIEGVNLPEDSIAKQPRIEASDLRTDDAIDSFLAIWDNYLERIADYEAAQF